MQVLKYRDLKSFVSPHDSGQTLAIKYNVTFHWVGSGVCTCKRQKDIKSHIVFID